MRPILRQRALMLRAGIGEVALLRPAGTGPRAEQRRPFHLGWRRPLNPRQRVAKIQKLADPRQ